MKITMLGTGHAMVTELYNTCYALQNTNEPAIEQGICSAEDTFLVDAGGGNFILHQLKHAGIKVTQIHDIFVTHKHVDHMMGVIWMARAITSAMSRGRYEGEARVYAHPDLCKLIESFSREVLDPRTAVFIGDRFKFVPVEDGDVHQVIGHPVTFFDLGPACKVRQFGMSMQLEDGRRITALGDETCHPEGEAYLKDSYLALHEAFCLDAEEAKYHPYQIGHSTVKTACELAKQFNVKNLVLYHTEDSHGADRKRLYLEEGKRYFDGGLYVPDDLESFEI